MLHNGAWDTAYAGTHTGLLKDKIFEQFTVFDLWLSRGMSFTRERGHGVAALVGSLIRVQKYKRFYSGH